jgi:hypothetical protein
MKKSIASGRLRVILISSISTMALSGPHAASQTPPPTGQSPAAAVGLYVYPQKNQSATQQAQDETQCYASAKEQSGVDPAAPPPPPQKPEDQAKGAGAKGAAKGAAGGAAVGAIAGDAGTGAAVGATVGAVHGRRSKKKAEKSAEQQAQTASQQQHAQALDSFKRAMSACLDARHYSVK